MAESPGLVQSIRRRLTLGHCEPFQAGKESGEVEDVLEEELKGPLSKHLGDASNTVVLKTVPDPSKSSKPEFTDKEMAVEGADSIGDVVKTFGENGISTSCMKGLKPESPNQDGFSVIVEDKFQMYVVLDGHGPHGHDISQFASDALTKLFLRSEVRHTDTEKAFKDAFGQTQRLLEMKTRAGDINADDSGTTCTVAYLPSPPESSASSQLYVAHVGDSRGVLGRWDNSTSRVQAVDLTVDHKPNNPEEKERIEKTGGRVVFDGYFNYRVYSKDGRGGLNMSRALGDIIAHNAGVTEVPQVAAIDILKVDLKEVDRFILLCSDGVWEFIESQDAVDIVARHGKENARKAVDELAKLSFEKWMDDSDSEVSDDITVVLVWL